MQVTPYLDVVDITGPSAGNFSASVGFVPRIRSWMPCVCGLGQDSKRLGYDCCGWWTLSLSLSAGATRRLAWYTHFILMHPGFESVKPWRLSRGVRAQLLAYRRGELDPAPQLVALPTPLQELVLHMIQLAPGGRPSPPSFLLFRNPSFRKPLPQLRRHVCTCISRVHHCTSVVCGFAMSR